MKRICIKVLQRGRLRKTKYYDKKLFEEKKVCTVPFETIAPKFFNSRRYNICGVDNAFPICWNKQN